MTVRLAGFVEADDHARTDAQVQQTMDVTRRVVELMGEVNDSCVLADVAGSVIMSIAMRFAGGGVPPEGFVLQICTEVLQAMPEIKSQHKAMAGAPASMN